MLPIPGPGSVDHLEENCAAATVELTDEEYDRPDPRRPVTAAGDAEPGSRQSDDPP
jgi:aryl-alcohol dehydrogenase-like predicted oxidoreductase